MTREQQRKLRELKKAESIIIKKFAKQYKFKKTDHVIWTVKDGLFFSLWFFENESDGKCYCTIRAQVKPLWADDILWDILDMIENKTAPLGLRGTGAFTINGVDLDHSRMELFNWAVQELEAYMEQAFEQFSRYVQETAIEYYFDNLKAPLYHAELRELTLLIHQQQYDKAIRYAEAMEHDYFQNGEITVKTGAINHCYHRKTIGKVD